MRLLPYILFIVFMVNTGIFVFLALQHGGLPIQWVAAACNGLVALLQLYRIFSMRQEKPQPPSDSK